MLDAKRGLDDGLFTKTTFSPVFWGFANQRSYEIDNRRAGAGRPQIVTASLERRTLIGFHARRLPPH